MGKSRHRFRLISMVPHRVLPCTLGRWDRRLPRAQRLRQQARRQHRAAVVKLYHIKELRKRVTVGECSPSNNAAHIQARTSPLVPNTKENGVRSRFELDLGSEAMRAVERSRHTIDRDLRSAKGYAAHFDAITRNNRAVPRIDDLEVRCCVIVADGQLATL